MQILKQLWRLWVVLLVLVGVSAGGVQAQEEQAILFLSSDTTEMQTGEFYTIEIAVRDVPEFWGMSATISYDPERLYIVGTASGSPVDLAEDLGDLQIGLFNRVDDVAGTLDYGVSLINPADPLAGDFTLGRFQVVPLMSGTVELVFSSANVSSLNFEVDENGQRTATDVIPQAFSPALLSLTITGDPATPPPEATATPLPTNTPEQVNRTAEPTITPEPTLVNITLAPEADVTATPAPTVVTDEPSGGGLSPLLIGAILAVLIGAGGLVGLFVARGRASGS